MNTDFRLSSDLTSLGGTAAGITWTWVNEVNRHDQEKRAYVSAMVGAPFFSPCKLRADGLT